MSKPILKTPCGTVEHLGDDFYLTVHYDYRNNDLIAKQVPKLDDAIRHFELLHEFTNHQKHYMLVDISKAKKAPPKEVRDYFASNIAAETFYAGALIVGSGISKIVGNIVLRFSNPNFPVRLFTNEVKAKEWLLEFKTKNSQS